LRRKDREITDFGEIVEVMKRCTVCHVAFRGDEYPYVVPMNFGMTVDDGQICLYFHSAKVGKKHELIQRNNRVAFVMEDAHSIVTGPVVGACESTMEFESVMGTGTLEYVREAEKVGALNVILDHYDVKEGESFHFHNEVVPSVAVLKLAVRDLSAKKRKVGKP
jgi:uncharacterized protein